VTPTAPAARPRSQPPADADPHARFTHRLREALADGSLVRLQLARPHPPAEPTLDKLLARPVRLRGIDHLALVWRHRSKDITKNLPLNEACALVEELLRSQFHHGHLLTRSHDVQLVHDRKGRWALRAGRIAPDAAAPGASDTAATGPRAAGLADGRAIPGAHGAGAGVDPTSPKTAPAATDEAPDAPGGAYLGHLARQGAADDAPDGRALAHDQARRYPLTLDLPFLAALGVTDAQARLIPSMARKWRQINKFVEVLGQAIARSPLAARAGGADAPPVQVLDFGAGRGYLTFAVHHHLRQAGLRPQVTGVELREALCDEVNGIIDTLGLDGLRFAAGDVRSHQAAAADVMIALHACDTATDVALHRGVAAGAALIVASPCCHKQLRPQMRAPELLAPVLRHGIHMAQQAEMLTDTLRALRLQRAGYDTQVFEFISPEATSKNKMVLAVRRSQPLPAARLAELQAQADALKAAFGITDFALDALFDAEPVA
jgi:hypothetical protein